MRLWSRLVLMKGVEMVFSESPNENAYPVEESCWHGHLKSRVDRGGKVFGGVPESFFFLFSGGPTLHTDR